MNEVKPLYTLKLLHTIQHRLGVESVVDLGLEYYQIARIISDLLENGYITDNQGLLTLTEAGEKKLEELNKQLYPSNHQTWLLPSEENRIPKIDKFDIYLPRKQREE